MATSHALVRVSLGRYLLPEYIRPTLDFTMMSPDGFDYDPAEAATLVENFFNNTATGAANAVKHYLQGSVLLAGTGAHHIKVYDLTPVLAPTPPPLGSPVVDTTFTISGTEASLPLPDECAVVLSYHADLTGVPEFVGRTRPAARRRGRVYLGPLDRVACSEDSGSPVVSPTFITDLNAAAKALLITGSSHWVGGVWSKTDHTVRRVVGGWVDNLFDVRDHRGDRRIAARTTFS